MQITDMLQKSLPSMRTDTIPPVFLLLLVCMFASELGRLFELCNCLEIMPIVQPKLHFLCKNYIHLFKQKLGQITKFCVKNLIQNSEKWLT